MPACDWVDWVDWLLVCGPLRGAQIGGCPNFPVEQMQTDLDSYLEHYNTQRPHQGRMMEGQTLYSMFKKGLKLIPKEVRSKVA